jgi:uncharacterized membrane protein
MANLKGLLYTVGIGAAAMYLLDPDLGRRRRSMVRDQFAGMQHDMSDMVDKGSRDLSNRASGLAAEAKSMVGMSEGGDTSIGSGIGRDWSPGIRLLATAAGGVLLVSGFARRGVMGTMRSMAGAALLARSLSNKPIEQFAGIGSEASKGGAIDVHRTIRINVPVDEVFKMWHNWENFPRFMSYLKEVKELGNGRSYWLAQGPAGIKAEWYARETRVVPNEVIEWESEPGSMVKNIGRVRFSEAPDGGTQLEVHLSYTPPAGVVGNALASLIGGNPEQKIAEDLNRFKSLLEQGVTTAHGETVRREQVK